VPRNGDCSSQSRRRFKAKGEANPSSGPPPSSEDDVTAACERRRARSDSDPCGAIRDLITLT